MRQERALRIRAFRKALELGANERAHECSNFPRWYTDLRNFPRGSCELASNALAQYLMDNESCQPCIIFMHGNGWFHKAENSNVHAHVIVLLDGEYIDLTLDQFAEYPEYIPAEPVESGGLIGTLLRGIIKHEGPVKTRKVDLDGMEELYAWLRDTTDTVLAADPDWQAWELSIVEARDAAIKQFPFLAMAHQNGTSVTVKDK